MLWWNFAQRLTPLFFQRNFQLPCSNAGGHVFEVGVGSLSSGENHEIVSGFTHQQRRLLDGNRGHDNHEKFGFHRPEWG